MRTKDNQIGVLSPTMTYRVKGKPRSWYDTVHEKPAMVLHVLPDEIRNQFTGNYMKEKGLSAIDFAIIPLRKPKKKYKGLKGQGFYSADS